MTRAGSYIKERFIVRYRQLIKIHGFIQRVQLIETHLLCSYVSAYTQSNSMLRRSNEHAFLLHGFTSTVIRSIVSSV